MLLAVMVRPSHAIFTEGCSEVSHSRIFYVNRAIGRALTLEEFEAVQQECTTICAPCMGPPCNCGFPPVHIDSVMISVDGACRRNGQPHATAACAVFFSPNSPYNETHVLTADGPTPTSQRAELTGGIKALEAAKRLVVAWDGDLNQIVIKADSAYLVRGATEWIPKWKCRGWKNAKGGPVVNQDLFQKLEDHIRELERMSILVQFFHVSRSQNREADAAANEALDRANAPTRVIATPFRLDHPPTERKAKRRGRVVGARSTVLLISLDSQPWFDEMYSNLISLLCDRTHIRRASEAKSALDYLESDKPATVLVTDPGIMQRKHGQVLERVGKYVLNGGTVIFCGLFSSFIRPSDLDTLFCVQFGLPWQFGRYRRTTFRLNEEATGSLPLPIYLPHVYRPKTVHLKGVEHKNALYLPEDGEGHTETATAWTSLGRGWVGFVGDVNAEEETDQVILSMCGL